MQTKNTVIIFRTLFKFQISHQFKCFSGFDDACPPSPCLPSAPAADVQAEESRPGAVHPKVVTKYDMFCLLMILIDLLVSRRNSTASFLVTLLAIHASLPAELKLICPRTWAQVLVFVEEQSPVDLIRIENFDVCPSDCVLFRKDLKDAKHCSNPSCASPRFDTAGKSCRQFHFILPSTYIKRWLKCPRWRQKLQYRHISSPGLYKDVHDGQQMKRILGGYDLPDGLHVIWAMGADGVCAREMDAYSVTPIFLTCLIFDPEFRYSWEALVCVGLVPGPGHNSLEPFLRPILEDISKPFSSFDVSTGELTLCQQSIAVIWADTQGLSDITCGNSPGAKAVCHQCDVLGVYLRSPGLQCMQYPGAWRSLPLDSKLRRIAFDTRIPGHDVAFDAPAPSRRTRRDIRRASALGERSHVQQDNAAHPSKLHYFHRKSYVVRILGSAFHIGVQVVADWAHEAQNFGRSMIYCFFGVECGAMNPGRIRLETKRGVFSVEALSAECLPWMLTLQEAASFNATLTSRRIPARHGGRSRPLVPGCVGRIKMAEWICLLGPVLVYCLQINDCFSRSPIYLAFWTKYLLWWFKTNRPIFPRKEIPDLRMEQKKLATYREILLPATCNSTTHHFEEHVADNLEAWGPSRFSTMLRDERGNGFITGCPTSGRGAMEKTMMSR